MIDLTKEDLYSKKKREMEKFLQNTLLTESQAFEHNNSDDFESIDGLGDGGFFNGFDDDDDGGFGDFGLDSGDGAYNPFAVDESKIADKEEIEKPPYEKENFAVNLLISPYYLFYYMVISIIENQRLRNIDDIKKFFLNQMKVSGVVLILTLFLLVFTKATFIFSLNLQAVFSVLLIGVSFIGYRLMDNPKTLSFFDKNGDGVMFSGDEDENEFADMDLDGNDDIFEMENGSKNKNKNKNLDDFAFDSDENDDFNFTDDDDDFKFDFDDNDSDGFNFEEDEDEGDFDFGVKKSSNSNSKNEFNFGDDFDIENEIDDNDFFNVPEAKAPVKRESTSVSKVINPDIIPHSPIDVSADDDVFFDTLRIIYKSNEKYRGVEMKNRKELVQSLSGYLIANDREFGEWFTVDENTHTYNNIMFTIYLGLIELVKGFKDFSDRNNRMVVNSCLENPLMYRVEIEVPNELFKGLANKRDTFEKLLKSSDEDTEVQVIISEYRNGYVFKIVKPIRSFVSLGDILRFHNDQIPGEQVYEKYMSESVGLPLLLGLRDAEYPVLVDLADNTSVVIAGESGSGKSWGTFLVMMSLVFSNDYNDLNIVIMDRKKATFWREFANMPHVVGYHTDVPEYFDLLEELNVEMERRKALLELVNAESWKGVRKSLLKKKQYDSLKLFPWLVIIIDEISNTQKEIIALEDGKDRLKQFDSQLSILAQEGRSLGMKLVLIGQRTVAESMPKNAMLNCSMKFLFKLKDSDVELTGMKLGKGIKTPQTVGQALIQDSGISEPILLRTLTVGGISDEQITNVIRILALEWTRRSIGQDLPNRTKLNKVYNRHVIREKVLSDIENDKLFVEIGGGADASAAIDALLNGEDVHSVKSKMNQLQKEKNIEDVKKKKAEEVITKKEKVYKDESVKVQLSKNELNEIEDVKKANVIIDDNDFDDNDFDDNDFDDNDFDNDDSDNNFDFDGLDGFDDSDDSDDELNFDEDIFKDIDFDFDDIDDIDIDIDIDFDDGDDSDNNFNFDSDDDDDDEFNFDNDSDNDFDKEEDLSVEDYIRKYGKKSALGFEIDKSILDSNYELKEIKRCLLRNKIIEKDNKYII